MGISPLTLMLMVAVLTAGFLGSRAGPTGVKKVTTPETLLPIKGENMELLCKFKTSCADFMVQFFGRFPDHDEDDTFFPLASYDGDSFSFPSSGNSPLNNVIGGIKSKKKASIIVQSIRPSDHGDYVCVVTAGNEEKNSTTKVFVLEPIPALGSVLLDVQTQERKIFCSSASLPQDDNVEMKIVNGTNIIASTMSPTENDHNNDETAIFSFTHEPVTLSKYDNAGIFKCQTKWKGTTYESENDIEQRYRATAIDMTVDQNPDPDNHNVFCITDAGLPAPVVLFYLDGSQVFGGITPNVSLSTTTSDANNGLNGRITEAGIRISRTVHDEKELCCRVSDLPSFPAGPLLQECTDLK